MKNPDVKRIPGEKIISQAIKRMQPDVAKPSATAGKNIARQPMINLLYSLNQSYKKRKK